MENKRMTWDEIVAKYPDKWVGLVDIDWKDGANVRSAVVKYTDQDADNLLWKQLRHEIEYSTYTTPENLMWNLPFGALTVPAEGSIS